MRFLKNLFLVYGTCAALSLSTAFAQGVLQATPPITTRTGNASSPTPSNTNVLIYDISPTNFGGVGADSSGNLYVVSGTSTPTTRIYIGASGGVNIGGVTDPGAGNLTLTGGINATGSLSSSSTISTSSQGSKLGAAGGSSTAPTTSNTNLLFYNNSSTNWSGEGIDGSGNFYLVTGTSGTPSTRLFIGAGGGVNIGGTSDPGAGNLSITGTYQVAGVALSASNLSNGVSGTGSVILQSGATITSPTINGTGAVNNYTVANNGIIVNDSAGTELFRLFSTGPNSGSPPYGGENTFFGWHSGAALPNNNVSAGYYNVGLGYQTLVSLLTGFDNTAAGVSSQEYNTTGNYNSSYGTGTLEFLTTGSNNTAMGHHALILLTTSTNNTAFGDSTLSNFVSGTGNNTAVGYTALFNDTGPNNTAVGNAALGGVTTGSTNIALGYDAGNQITTGNYNVMIGNYSGAAAISNEVDISDGVGNLVFQANATTPLTRLPYVTGGPGMVCISGTGALTVNCNTSAGNAASPTNTNTAFLLYSVSTTNWAGIGDDGSGDVYIVTGSSAPATRLFIGVAGGVNIGGTSDPGAGKLTVTSSISAGGTIASTGGAISTTSQGSVFGGASGSSTAPTTANTNLIFYNAGAANWSGIGADSSGNTYLVTGTSGTPSTRLFIGATGGVNIGGTSDPGAGKLSVTSTVNATGYNVSGTALAAANLSDGNTGTGSIVHTTSPTIADIIDSDKKVSTAAITYTSNTTLAAITNLTINVTAGATYACYGHLTITASSASGGIKLAMGGTATATSMSFTGANYNGTTTNARSTATALGNTFGASTAALTDIQIDGSIVVNAAGTLFLEAAQNASFATGTTVGPNSNFGCTRTN